MRFQLILAAILSALLFACSESSSTAPREETPSLSFISFESSDTDSLSDSSHTVFITRKSSADTLVVDSLALVDGYSLYLAADNDPVDPALGARIGADSAIAVPGVDSVRLVVLNAKNVIDAVWTVRWKDIGAGSSSSAAGKNSSSSVAGKSSSSAKAASSGSAQSSSSAVVESSSAKSSSSATGESSSAAASSSAGAVSSSAKSSAKSISVLQLTVSGSNLVYTLDSVQKKISVTLSTRNALDSVQVKRLTVSAGATCGLPTATNLSFVDPLNSGIATYSFKITAEDGSSDTWSIEATYPLGVNLSDLAFTGGTVAVTGNKIYVEVPYGTDISAITLLPLDTANDLRDWKTLYFVDATGALAAYSVKAGYQVPGSDFSARDNSFWATTSDAMATEGSATVALVTNYKFTSSANLVEDGSSIALYTKEVVCAWGIGSAVISGGWKMATGAYFAGTFSGADAKNIYDVDYSGGTPSTGASDISKLMSFGRPFTARPDSFAVTYSYAHVANSSSDYPQKDLIYVMLVSADKKVVATGAVIDDASVETTTKRVALSYGADPNGLLTGGYPVASGLTLGSGTEEVASIHIMFASSAYAYVVAGGAAGSSGKYRGGENSELVLDQFKLVY